MIDVKTFLQTCLPDGWELQDDQLFAIHDQSGKITWQTESATQEGDSLCVQYRHVQLHLDVTFTKKAVTNALTCQVNISNTGQACTLTRIEPLLLSWNSSDSTLYISHCAGGTNEHHYPPAAFREHRVRADDSAMLWIENGFDGRSSNFHLPMMSIEDGDNAVSGGLAWSGLWWMSGGGSEHGPRRFSCHVPIDNLQLEQGETLVLPTAHYVFSNKASSTSSNAMRRYIRDDLAAKTPEPLRPQAIYNHWFGIGPDINADVFKRQCDQAKAYGIDYVVLDAGWYGGCSETNFSSGVGNWERIDTKKFPSGLEEVSTYVDKQGLKFGLWFEVERAHRDSDWAKQHPDWYMDIGKDYLHLDMSNDKAVDACIELISQAVQRYNCQWLKLDYNIDSREYWRQKDPSGKIQFAYMQGLYRFFDTIRERHPDVILENCASGGRRIDLGTIEHTHIQNLTDQTSSAAICRYMMHGAQAFLPANICPIGLPFGNRESHGVNDDEFSAYHVLSRFCGLPTLYGDIASNGTNTQAQIKPLLALHAQYRDVFEGDFYRLTPQAVADSDVEAVIHMNKDGDRGLLLIFSGLAKQQYPMFLNVESVLNASQLIIQKLVSLRQPNDSELIGQPLSDLQNLAIASMEASSVLIYGLACN